MEGINFILFESDNVTPTCLFIPWSELSLACKNYVDLADEKEPILLHYDGNKSNPLLQELQEIDRSSLEKMRKIPYNSCPLVIAYLG